MAPKTVWRVLAIVTAVVLYVLALSNNVYELTSPAALPFHVVFRKLYSLIAFALLGYLVNRAYDQSMWSTAIWVAIFSASIEAGQDLGGSTQGPAWNAFDTLCGAVGGAAGAWVAGAPLRTDRR